MNKEDIIYALHCCTTEDYLGCNYCPYDNTDENCSRKLMKDAKTALEESINDCA